MNRFLFFFSTDVTDLTVSEIFLFDPSTYEMDISIEISDNSVSSEKRKEFNISIANIEAINSTGRALTAVEGEPLKVIVFDNDCK